MIELMAEIEGNSPRKLSRRDFLKGAAATFAGTVAFQNARSVSGALAALGRDLNPTEEQMRENVKNQEHKNLIKHAFPMNYASLVEETVEPFDTRYNARLPILPFHNTNVKALYDAATDYEDITKADRENIDILKNIPWGTKIAERATAVEDKLQSVPKDHNLADFLKRVAHVYPLHVLALPDTIQVGEHFAYDQESLTLPTNIPEPILVTYILSAGQKYLNQEWQKITPFISFENYKDQLKATTDEVTALAETYFDLPWEKAKSFYLGNPLLQFEGDEQALEHHTKYFEEYGIKFPPLPDTATQQDRELRYNELVHQIGKELLDRDRAVLKGDSDYSSLYGYYSGAHARMEELLNRLSDIVTQPPANAIGALHPSLQEELQDPSFNHPLSRAQMRIWDRITTDTSKFNRAALPDEIYNAFSFADPSPKTPDHIKQSDSTLTVETPLVNTPEAKMQRVIEQLGPQFLRLYSLHEKYTYLYGDQNPMNVFFRRVGTPFDNLTGVFQEIAEGKDTPELRTAIQRLTAGWNEKGDETTQQVNNAIDSMNIVIPHESGRVPAPQENVDRMRWFLKNAGKYFPYNILAMPQQVALFFNGGGLAGHDEITLNFPGKDPTQYENAVISWMHESTHLLEDAWERVKPYIPQEKYINYAQFELEQVYNTADYYFSLPWEQAMRFKTGEPMILLGKGSVPDIIKHGQSIAGYQQPEYVKTKDGVTEYSYYYNHLAHWCGSELLKLGKKNPATLSKAEKDRLNDPTLREMARHVLDEIAHYFVGPVPGDKHHFPRSDDEYLRGVLEDNNLQVQRAKFASFANVDPNISAKDLSAIFGLP